MRKRSARRKTHSVDFLDQARRFAGSGTFGLGSGEVSRRADLERKARKQQKRAARLAKNKQTQIKRSPLPGHVYAEQDGKSVHQVKHCERCAIDREVKHER